MTLYLLFLKSSNLIHRCHQVFLFYDAGSDYIMAELVKEKSGRGCLNNG